MNELDITIHPIAALKDNYIWGIVNTKKKCALIVDPGDAKPVIAWLKQHHLDLNGILITHHHWDHVNGVTDLLKHSPVSVFGSLRSQFSELTHRVDDGELVFINDYFPAFNVMSIPGHTLDHIAYYGNGNLFCGDTLFAGGCGRLFEGTAEQLYDSLQKMTQLPDDTKIYCAHEYTVNNLRFAYTVEPGNKNIMQRMERVRALREKDTPSIPSLLLEEKQTNPFLRCEIPDIIEQVEKQMKRPLNRAIDVFSALREWKNVFF